MALLTLFMGVGLEQTQVLILYMLGWKGFVLGIPKMYHTKPAIKRDYYLPSSQVSRFFAGIV